MMNISVTACLLTLVVSATHSLKNFPQENSISFGSLVVLIPSIDGVVVCADKRVEGKSYHSDHIVKIFRLNPSALLTIAGTLGVSKPGNFEDKIVDYFVLMQNFLSVRDIERIDSYTAEIEDVLNRQIQVTPIRQLRTDRGMRYLATYGILYVNKDQEIRGYNIVAGFVESVERKWIAKIYIDHYERNFADIGSTKMFGNYEVVEELRRTKNKFFMERMNKLALNKFNRDTTSQNISLQESLLFGQTLIKATNEGIGDQKSTISSNCDCAMIHRSRGFKWLSRG